MRTNKIALHAVFSWVLVALTACGAGGGFSGESGKSSGSKATKPAKSVETVDEGTDDDGSSPGVASPAAVKPTWAEGTTVECSFDAIESQFHVLMTCTYVHADGTEVKRTEVPEGTEIDLQLLNESGNPIGIPIDPAQLGLVGFGDFFKKVFVAPVQQVFQAAVQVVQTVQQVVGTVQQAIQQAVQVVIAPVVKAVSKFIPGVETLAGLGSCATTAVFPAFCFIKFGVDIKNKLDGNQAPDPASPFSILTQLVKDGLHIYTGVPEAFKGQGFTEEGGAFRLFKLLNGASLAEDQKGDTQLFACTTFAGARNFISTDPKCEGQNFVAKQGFVFKEKKDLTLPVYRCHDAIRDDHILSSDRESCVKSGFGDIVELGYAPLSVFKT